jgi:hypothetical protein
MNWRPGWGRYDLEARGALSTELWSDLFAACARSRGAHLADLRSLHNNSVCWAQTQYKYYIYIHARDKSSWEWKSFIVELECVCYPGKVKYSPCLPFFLFRREVRQGMRSSEFHHCRYSTVNLISFQSSDRDLMAQIWRVLQYHEHYFLKNVTVSVFGWISTAQSRTDG